MQRAWTRDAKRKRPGKAMSGGYEMKLARYMQVRMYLASLSYDWKKKRAQQGSGRSN